MADLTPKVQGNCPACGRASLFLGTGGHVTCSELSCPKPEAPDRILADRETEHIVTIRNGDYTIKHPLREHLDGGLDHCELHDHLSGLNGPPLPSGQWRAQKHADGKWSWMPINEVQHA